MSVDNKLGRCGCEALESKVTSEMPMINLQFLAHKAIKTNGSLYLQPSKLNSQ